MFKLTRGLRTHRYNCFALKGFFVVSKLFSDYIAFSQIFYSLLIYQSGFWITCLAVRTNDSGNLLQNILVILW